PVRALHGHRLLRSPLGPGDPDRGAAAVRPHRVRDPARPVPGRRPRPTGPRRAEPLRAPARRCAAAGAVRTSAVRSLAVRTPAVRSRTARAGVVRPTALRTAGALSPGGAGVSHRSPPPPQTCTECIW